jgi:hypothetical protein
MKKEHVLAMLEYLRENIREETPEELDEIFGHILTTYRNAFRRVVAEVERLKPFEEELTAMVDRLGHDGGAVCNWDSRNKLPAKVWADAAYKAAQDNEQHEREQGRQEVQSQLDACSLELKELKASIQ